MTTANTMNFTARVADAIINPPPSPESLFWGWDEELDLGTEGDYFVDAVNGSDSNNGTSAATAFATITKATTESAGGDTIRIMGDGVKYRELIVPKSGTALAYTKYLGYGTDKPIVTAANVLDNLVACTSADADIVGADNWGSCFRQTLSKSIFAEGGNQSSTHPRALNLHENDQRLYMCREWGGADPLTTRLQTKTGFNKRFWSYNNADWLTADEILTNGSNIITGYTLPAAITSKYTQVQIERGFALYYSNPNQNRFGEITAFDPATRNITVSNVDSATASTAPNRLTINLMNILPNIKQGEWGYVDNGDETVTVYVWPNNPANVAAGLIEYSRRAYGIDTTGKNYIQLEGLDVRQAAGIGTRDGACLTAYTVSKETGLIVRNCRFWKNSQDNQRAAVYVQNTDKVIFENNTVQDTMGSFGVFFQGGSGVEQAEDLVFRRNRIEYTEQTGPRFYRQLRAVIAHNKMQFCGLAAHANKTNVYSWSNSILFWANVFIDCDGYMTHQATSDIFVSFNYVPATFSSNGITSRAYEDQSGSGGDSPTSNTNSLFFNNSFLPHPIGTTLASVVNGFRVGRTQGNNAQNFFEVVNNYFHGAEPTLQAQCPVFNFNLNTASDGAYGANDQTAAIGDVFTDHLNGDFSVPALSPLRTANTTSLTGYIDDVLKPIFGARFDDWNLDPLGDAINPADPPMGCLANPDRYAELSGILYVD